MNQRTFTSRPQAGFTMMEIALALVVAVIGLMGIFALFPAGLTASRAAKDDSRVAVLAESILSDVRAELNRDFDLTLYEYETGPSTLQIGSRDLLYELNPATGGAGEPIAACRLTWKDIGTSADRLVEVQLECWPGLQKDRKLVFYTRVANRNRF